MNESYYWWYTYGQFASGQYNLPHIGNVIAYYFELSGLSKEELARILNCSERYIEMLKSPKNKDMPQLLSRRILLAKILHIPPILLGLSSITLTEWGDGTVAPSAGPTGDAVVSSDTMVSYERMLALSWELYYTSSVQKAAGSIDDSFQRLNAESVHATGVKSDQYDAMRCRFYQLNSLVLRDRMALDEAVGEASKAVAIAFHIKNAELIASSLLRRARIYIRQQAYTLALTDAETMLPYANLSRDPLKGKCYQMAGEAQGYLAGESKSLQDKSLAYFDKAAYIARKGNLAPDGSFVKTDLTSIYIERAEALTLFGRFNEAHRALAIARKNLSPELTRWQVNLLLAEADTYLAEREIDHCCYTLIDALPIVRAVSLSGKAQRLQTIYHECAQIAPDNSLVNKLGTLLVTPQPLLS